VTSATSGVGASWHHIALVYDKDAANEATLYFDGTVLDSWSQFDGNLDNSDTSPFSLGLARPGDDNWGDFAGLIDEAFVYTRALTPDDVAALYDAGLAGTYNSVLSLDTVTGTGTLTGDIEITDSLAPGNSAGTLTVDGNLELTETTVLDFEIGSSEWDFVDINGDLVLDGTLNISDLGDLGAGTYDLLAWSGTLTDNGLVLGAVPEGWSSDMFTLSVLETGSGIVQLQVIPEPASILLLVAGTALVFFGVEIQGNLAALAAGFFLVLISIFSIGLVIASTARDVKRAGMICSIVYFPMLLFSGTTIPFPVFPEFVQKAAMILPLRHGIMLLNGLAAGEGFAGYIPQVLILAVIATAGILLSLASFRWDME
ncbi:MAG: LamG-like jellyroll fold domain-containing protein, partial [Spirochaeta sp.]